MDILLALNGSSIGLFYPFFGKKITLIFANLGTLSNQTKLNLYEIKDY